ncbi:SRPBCC domain-containing protein [Brevibacillus ruminantium]|uniref:SRPBCC domain-containing protein n=1 Tax=Brevibacillus ruminantium TaxID=2950604 RepID=A0ABY4WGY0_9BACL|nr:SRPBCC domain-containing protein [Brevibacillus ruminantium]USG66405.1 SRPBCC domain-containing protein [Brevibacillus ruminantium]
MDKIIHKSVRLSCQPEQAFQFFTKSEHLANWLTNAAEVEPVVGGKYELFWAPDDRENDSTIGCKILALEPGKLLVFEWKGTRQFASLMNEVRPLTQVVISFLPDGDGTNIQLIHNGWGATAEWEAARAWFEMAWNMAFAGLEKYVNAQPVEKCCE